VPPLVTRLQKSFQAWLQPGFAPFRFDYNADRLEALPSGWINGSLPQPVLKHLRIVLGTLVRQ
jgi:hypothetical protein